jgi:hypothetical protein
MKWDNETRSQSHFFLSPLILLFCYLHVFPGLMDVTVVKRSATQSFIPLNKFTYGEWNLNSYCCIVRIALSKSTVDGMLLLKSQRESPGHH